MYIYRLVVDANCINAKNLIPSMTELERYHSAGAIELLVTTTLVAELDRTSLQAQKASQYQAIGGIDAYFAGNDQAQSVGGACVRASLLDELQRELFGNSLTGHTLHRALRDCLHLDQAQMNAADIFITNDKRLYKAVPMLQQYGIGLAVISPDEALEFVRSYLSRTIGKSDVAAVEAICRNTGPLILGSNSCGPCSLVSFSDHKPVIDFQIVNGLLHVHALLWNPKGELTCETKPGMRPIFHDNYVRITQVGRGPIVVGLEPFSSVVLADKSGGIYIAMRTTHSGRVVVYEMSLRDSTGEEVASVRCDALELRGSSLCF